MSTTVGTILGPVPASELGVIAVHESLLSVVPGAQYAFDITMDRAEIFDVLEAALVAFRGAGGGTIVDRTGMFHGRDLGLYEALSRTTGVHIIASTGMGPEENLGGYFLTPQTNPPTPWPAERFAELFAAEVSEGMVAPRVERRAGAGLVVTALTEPEPTPTDLSLLRGAARAAAATGVPLSFTAADPAAALDVIAEEGRPRVVIAGADRRTVAADAVALAARGAYVALDHVGSSDEAYLTGEERIALVQRLIAAGHADRVILSSSSVGVAKGFTAAAADYAVVLREVVPALRAAGVSDADIDVIITENPRVLFAGVEA